MASTPERENARAPYLQSDTNPSPDSPTWAAINRAFLRFSRTFGVFGAMSIEQRDEINHTVLRRVVAVGYLMGSIAMGGAVLFEGSKVGPVELGAAAAVFFLSLSLLTGFVKALPPKVVRILAFDTTVISLCCVIAIGREPAYIALLYFGWPVLTSAHFGTAWEFTRTLLLMAVGLPIALAFSDVSVPLLAYGGVMIVAGFSAVVLRAIVFQATVLFRELEHIASTDVLTGLLNRRAATVELEEAVARAHRQNTDLSIVIFDIDHFKRINDSMGHPAGDAALQRFAGVLLDSCSGTDVAARLGGEEFLVILLRSDESGARAFAERFSERLDFQTANDPAPLSVSGGVAALDGERVDADGLLVAADRALYAAKRSGRHRIVAVSDAGVKPLSPQP
ncbi:MAG: GGDEF domain-containing protein [Solirubrobacteraceae bacterium]|nr:GGDEF domain-containing protein [Solirubrobacteraceae bacterium]